MTGSDGMVRGSAADRDSTRGTGESGSRRRPDGRRTAANRRGQLSLTAVEAAVGVVFVLGVAATFVAAPAGSGSGGAQLDTYAADAATVLANEPPHHGDDSRLAEVCASPAAFDRERDALRRRTERVLPANLLFRLRTPHGTVGFRPPTGVRTGWAVAPLPECRVIIRVWYA